MDLYKEILIHALAQERIEVRFPELKLDAQTLVESVCYRALEEIRAILRDDTHSDPACFHRIEAIVTTLESIGSHGGDRHDFG